MDSNLDVSERLFPLIVNLVLEDKLNVTGICFHGVYEQEGYFIGSECLLPDYVVNQGLRLVVCDCRELVSLRGHFFSFQ